MNSRRAPIGVDVDQAVRVLRAGGLVGLPTETVYGLAAAIDHEDACRRIFVVKGRPTDHPLIVHVADIDAARGLSSDWPDTAEALGTEFWPGPLTLVVNASAAIPTVVTGGRPTVAIRVPAHPLAQEVLRRLGSPVAAPSANRFGKVSPTSAAHVADDLDGDVDYVLDGDSSTIGLESTIVDCTTDPPQILRPGAVDRIGLQAVLGRVAAASGPTRAPGMLPSHYAPRCRVVAVDDESELDRVLTEHAEHRLIVLDGRSDPHDFGTRLYESFRRADREHYDVVVVLLPDAHGIGEAIRDRVLKAAADRDR